MGVVADEGVRRSRSPVPVYHLEEAFLPRILDVSSLSLLSRDESGGCRSFAADEDGFEPPPAPPPPQVIPIPIVPNPSQLCSWGVNVAAEGLDGVSDGVDFGVLTGSAGRREMRRRRREGGNEDEEET